MGNMEPATPRTKHEPVRNSKGHWLPGQTGNPYGRPHSFRERFGVDFLRDALESWKKHGKAALEQMRQEDNSGYVKAMVSLVPKELIVRDAEIEQMDADELHSLLEVVRAIRAKTIDAEPAK